MTRESSIHKDGENLAGGFPLIVHKVMRLRKDSYEREFGNSSYFGIEGLIILGVANDVSETDSSERVDVCLISTGETYDLNFIDTLAREAKRSVHQVGTIFIKKGQSVDSIEEEWKKQSQSMGHSADEPFRMVLVRTLSLL